MSELAGQVALITGAGAGLGRAYAIALAGAGAGIIIQDIDPAGAEESAGLVRAAGGEARTILGDIADVDDFAAKVGGEGEPEHARGEADAGQQSRDGGARPARRGEGDE